MQDLTHKERTTCVTWSYVLLDSSAAPPGFHPSLHETRLINNKSFSGSHVHKQRTFVIEVTPVKLGSEENSWNQV